MLPIAQSVMPIHATTPKPALGSTAISANGSEKNTTKRAWNWKNQKNFRFAFSLHFARSD